MSANSKSKKNLHLGRDALKIVQEFFPDTTKVEDANKDLVIEVTKKDTATAKRYGHKECALAVACKNKKNLDGVIVARTTAYLIKDNKAMRFKLPPSVQKEIVSFDRGGGFEEGTYELKKPSKWHRLGLPKLSGKINNRGSVGKRYHHVTMNVRSALGS